MFEPMKPGHDLRNERLSAGAMKGKVPCGKSRSDFETYGELDDHLKHCEMCAVCVEQARLNIENARKYLAKGGE